MSKEIIQQIAEATYPTTFEWGGVVLDDALCGTKRQVLREALTALEPFIPKWVKVEDELPMKGEMVMCRWHSDLKWAVSYDLMIDEDGFRKVSVVEWMRISTTHPFEALLNQLTNK